MADTTKRKPSQAVCKVFMSKAWLKEKKSQNASKQAWYEEKAAQTALAIEANKRF